MRKVIFTVVELIFLGAVVIPAQAAHPCIPGKVCCDASHRRCTKPKPKPKPKPRPALQQSSQRTSLGSSATQQNEVLIVYTDGGFSPSTVTIRPGQAVQFLNSSTGSFWVASNPHPIHSDLHGFDAGRPMSKGSTYRFPFTQTGTFGYHNHVNPSVGGTITVR